MKFFNKTRLKVAFPRVALGVIFSVSGLCGLSGLGFNSPYSDEGQKFIGMLVSNHVWLVIKVLETICGAALLFGVLDVFAIFILAPLVVGILFFHLVLSPEGLPLAVGVFILEVMALWRLRHHVKSLLDPPTHRNTAPRGP